MIDTKLTMDANEGAKVPNPIAEAPSFEGSGKLRAQLKMDFLTEICSCADRWRKFSSKILTKLEEC